MLTKDLATVKRDREKAVKARDLQVPARAVAWRGWISYNMEARRDSDRWVHA